jgi:hypothetical protein
VNRLVTSLTGAITGLGVGLLLLVLTHPTSAYLNDAFRSGASMGFVLRYVVLGVLAALLIGALRRHAVPAGLGLTVVLALAIVPPALDTQTASEQRRAAAVAEDDPVERGSAEFRAGAIDGCVRRSKQELRAIGRSKTVDADAYCTCFIDAVTAGPRDDEAQLDAVNREVNSGSPSAKLQGTATRCMATAMK